jgi:hypothetical protein
MLPYIRCLTEDVAFLPSSYGAFAQLSLILTEHACVVTLSVPSQLNKQPSLCGLPYL